MLRAPKGMQGKNYTTGFPDNLYESLVRYRDNGIPTGGFLRACLENDLLKSCEKADQESRKFLYNITFFLYNDFPSSSWGSSEKVDSWLAGEWQVYAARTALDCSRCGLKVGYTCQCDSR